MDDRDTSPATQVPGPASPGVSVSRDHVSWRLWVPAMLSLLGFVVVYLTAVWTPVGQRAENALFTAGWEGETGGSAAWVYDYSGHYGAVVAIPPLNSAGMPTLLVGLVLLAIVTVVRRRWWVGVASIATVVITIGASVVGKDVLPRPDLVAARESLLATSFPSGHVAIPVALTLAAALIAPRDARRPVVAIGTVWIAFSAAAVLATYQHRVSDALGATLLACAVYLCVAPLLRGATTRAQKRDGRSVPWVTLTLAVLAAVVGGARTDSFVEPLVFVVTGLVCAALVWFVARYPGPRPQG